MKKGETIVKITILILFIGLIVSLTTNVYQWREFLSVTTLPGVTGSGERVSLVDRYAELRKQVNRRLGMGRDVQSFITPDSPAVSALVKELTTDYADDPKEYWRNCELLYRWVILNIDYVPDSYVPMLPENMNGEITWVNDCWRTPEETLRDKAGDCEDLSALLASMLLNYNKHTYGVWMVEVRNQNSGHVGVAFPIENGMITIVDPSIRYNTATAEGGTIMSSKEAGTAINLWLERLQDKVPGAKVTLVFSDTLYQEFTGTNDFLNWVKANVK
jgi:hypothetical protein